MKNDELSFMQKVGMWSRRSAYSAAALSVLTGASCGVVTEFQSPPDIEYLDDLLKARMSISRLNRNKDELIRQGITAPENLEQTETELNEKITAYYNRPEVKEFNDKEGKNINLSLLLMVSGIGLVFGTFYANRGIEYLIERKK